ncbi:hypothetical protein BC826DRAFT_1065877 [Russula brevipes]|nr:hypothetical protein BC826DRAFT_1065877 [Russula brevipes]
MAYTKASAEQVANFSGLRRVCFKAIPASSQNHFRTDSRQEEGGFLLRRSTHHGERRNLHSSHKRRVPEGAPPRCRRSAS